MTEKTVLYERQGQLAFIKFNRPYRLNAINAQLIRDFVAALERARKDRRALAVILKGEGRAFCAGDDIKDSVEARGAAEWGEVLEGIQEVTRSIARLGKPIIAAVAGYALGGGCEFAMNCDIRIASEEAKFGFPEVSLGAVVTCAGTQQLAQLVGVGRAKEMILTTEMIDARQAEKWGLVNKVVPLAKLDEAAREMALKIAGHSSLAVRLMRSAIDRGTEINLEGILELEAGYGYTAFALGETQRGMAAGVKRIGRAREKKK